MRIKNCFLLAVLSTFMACENRSINEGEEFRPKEIHENINYHFDKITVDGVEYLILSRDNNNPHEGFGFMAFRANELTMKQDSILAYMKTSSQLQVEMYAKIMGMAPEQAKEYNRSILEDNFSKMKGAPERASNSYSSTPRK